MFKYPYVPSLIDRVDIIFEEIFCEKKKASTPLGTERYSTGNRKNLGSIPSGVEAFLFSQKIPSKIILKISI